MLAGKKEEIGGILPGGKIINFGQTNRDEERSWEHAIGGNERN
jgi:hypothetical protein